MEQNLENHSFDLKDANVKILKKNTHNVMSSRVKSHKCNQCDFASSHTGSLRRHLKTHSGEKSNNCNQCDFASYRAYLLRIHLKTHSEENLLITLTKKLHHVAASEIAQEWEFQSSTPRNLKLINIKRID